MKKMIECPICRGEGFVGSTEMRMTRFGVEDTSEICERCNGTGKIEVGSKPHPEPLPTCGGASYSIYLPE